MITSKKDLKYYLLQDKIALKIERRYPRFIGDEVWKFQIALRKVEYYINCRNSFLFKPLVAYFKFKKYILMLLLGFSIPNNVFGPGLSISHPGTIIVNSRAKIGKNCRINNCVVIGSAPIIVDNCYIGPGAKIFGNISIANNTRIGANAVINKTIVNDGVTVVGSRFHVVNKK